MNDYKTNYDRSSGRSGGISFCGLLAIVFITLKLVGIDPVASWSWWWVLSPIWIPAVIIFIVAICVIWLWTH